MIFDQTLLVVDDDKNTRDGLKSLLEIHGYEVSVAADGYHAIDTIKLDSPGIVLTDVRMPEMDGLTLLEHIKKIAPETLVIVLTAYGSVEDAVKAMQTGAFHYLTKPINTDELLMVLKKAIAHRKLQRENSELKLELKKRGDDTHIIYESEGMADVLDLVRQVAPTNASIFITGESGTGKELVARSIHSLSLRAKEDFVPVHCASLTPSLLSSELFGHERGSFTGATERKIGRFERAHKGTLFLDEIGEINEQVQVNLLRVLQEGEFERVGGTKLIKADVRLITATNKDLQTLIADGRFREDLYYRLNVVSIHVPSLRERKKDIAPLVRHYLDHFSVINHKNVRKISDDALQVLYAYDWPGNIRELKNSIERMVVLAKSECISLTDIPADLRNNRSSIMSSDTTEVFSDDENSGKSLRNMEQSLILQTLSAVNGNKSKAAEKLGISRRTLYRKLSEYGIV